MSEAKLQERWAFRVSSDADQLVRRAAATARRSLTDFVVAAAVVEAEHVLADRTHFVLDAPQWERFVESLDQPPRARPDLQRLFAESSVFAAE